ncbi:MAG: hypothetical protein QFF03_21540 [Pseudomonadota bacterium]|nr:hypothetical protein [Pseudomonadota bacterium]
MASGAIRSGAIARILSCIKRHLPRCALAGEQPDLGRLPDCGREARAGLPSSYLVIPPALPADLSPALLLVPAFGPGSVAGSLPLCDPLLGDGAGVVPLVLRHGM